VIVQYARNSILFPFDPVQDIDFILITSVSFLDYSIPKSNLNVNTQIQIQTKDFFKFFRHISSKSTSLNTDTRRKISKQCRWLRSAFLTIESSKSAGLLFIFAIKILKFYLKGIAKEIV